MIQLGYYRKIRMGTMPLTSSPVGRRKAHKDQNEEAGGAKRRSNITMAVQKMAVNILI